MFQKGHPYYGGVGKKGRSGSKKSLTTLVKEVMETDRQRLPAYFQSLSEKARNGDREAAIYLIDRHLGKPKQQTEILGGEKIGAGLMVELMKVLQEQWRELNTIEGEFKQIGGDDGQSVTAGEDQREG